MFGLWSGSNFVHSQKRKTYVDPSSLFLIQGVYFFVISIQLMLSSVHWNIPPLFTCKAATISVIYWFDLITMLQFSTNYVSQFWFVLYWPLVDYFVITISTITPPKYHSMKLSHVQWLASQVPTCDRTGVTADRKSLTCDTNSVTCVQLWHGSLYMWQFYMWCIGGVILP